MLTLKLMSGEDLPDNDSRKNFTLIQIEPSELLQFHDRGEQGEDASDTRVYVVIRTRDGAEQSYDLVGNAYVMNAQGKTIASRSSY